MSSVKQRAGTQENTQRSVLWVMERGLGIVMLRQATSNSRDPLLRPVNASALVLSSDFRKY